MAASYIFGLAASDVAGELPGIDADNVDASSDKLTTTLITSFINDGAGKLNVVLDKSGIESGSGMDADTHQVCAVAVKNYAIHKSLLVLGITGPVYEAARDEWASVYTEYSNRPQQLGDEYADGLTVAVDSLTSFNSTNRLGRIDADIPVDEWME